MKINEVPAAGVRFSVDRGEKEVGRAYLYLLRNDLHERPFGLLEDVHVDESCREQGVAAELLEAVLFHARNTCYKLIATSRADGSRDSVHAWYVRLGFSEYGREFRITF